MVRNQTSRSIDLIWECFCALTMDEQVAVAMANTHSFFIKHKTKISRHFLTSFLLPSHSSLSPLSYSHSLYIYSILVLNELRLNSKGKLTKGRIAYIGFISETKMNTPLCSHSHNFFLLSSHPAEWKVKPCSLKRSHLCSANQPVICLVSQESLWCHGAQGPDVYQSTLEGAQGLHLHPQLGHPIMPTNRHIPLPWRGKVPVSTCCQHMSPFRSPCDLPVPADWPPRVNILWVFCHLQHCQ